MMGPANQRDDYRERRVDIEHIDHIGMVVEQLEPQVELLERLFGFAAERRIRDESAGVERVRLAVPGTAEIDWEVTAPTREGSSLQGFLDSPLGPGLHHVGMLVPDLSATAGDLRRLGIEPERELGGTSERPVEEILIHPRRGGHGFQFRFRSVDGAAPPLEAPPMREGALGVTAIDHLSHAHDSPDELVGWYGRVFGMEGSYYSDQPGGGFATKVLETPTRQMHWEVIQPRGDDSFVASFLERRGPAIHHVAFEVADWDTAVAACATHGIDLFDESEGVRDGARWVEGFIHPRQTGGMLVQLFWEERPGIWVQGPTG